MIYLLRGPHANEFELQNYAPLVKKFDIKVVTSHQPLTPITLPTIQLKSPADTHFPFQRQILNRLIGGEQWLLGLEKVIDPGSIIHTAETYPPYTHQAVELKKKGIISKLVCTCWETIPHANEKFSRLKRWKEEAHRAVDIFHVPTERAKNALLREGVSPQKIIVIPYGIDISRFHPLRHALHRRPLILTVARLEREKGMEDIEEVAKLLPQCDFHIIGAGKYHPRGKNISVKSMPYQEIHRAFQSADIFFLPSRTTHTWEEQYGMSLLEAMACGLPIVATRSGAIPEVVGKAGILVPEQCIDKMTNAITSLINDPGLRLQLSQLALSRSKSHYDSRKVALELSSLYHP